MRGDGDGDRRPYRRGVGALLFNGHGEVFVARRVDTADGWQLPQGGIDDGERPRQAVLRELAEEIGTGRAVILAKSARWYCYDLPAELRDRVWRGRYRGQKQRWFALRFTGEESDINLNASSHPEFNAWRWVDLGSLPALAVPFKRQLYSDLTAEFTPLVQSIIAGPVSSPPGGV
jgi:putative (di)nucleoside polyphosphate hydrolase